MSAPVKLAVYDFDGTLIRGDSIVAYLRFAMKRGCLSPFSFLKAAFAGLMNSLGLWTPGKAKAWALRFWQKLPKDKREALDRDFAETLLGRIRPGGLCQMVQDQAAGRTVLLLSASTDNYMLPLSERLGADGLICTRISDLPEGNCRGYAKVERLKEWLTERGWEADLSASAAYADSLSDEPILALVGHPVLVDPKPEVLKQLGSRFPSVHWPDPEE